jgi:hypothetical protein
MGIYMTKKEISRARQSVARLRDEGPSLLEAVLEREPLLKAYLDSSPRTCGVPACRCTRGEKHPAWVVRIPQGKTSRSRSVPEDTFRRLQPLAREYRQFRQKLARLRRLFEEADAAFRVIEASRLVDLEAELSRQDAR